MKNKFIHLKFKGMGKKENKNPFPILLKDKEGI